MATKRFYATRDLKNPSYGTRMLKAGDPVDLDGPKARLYLALGAVTATRPKTDKPQLDHDNDGKAGGSEKGAASTRAKGARKRKAKK